MNYLIFDIETNGLNPSKIHVMSYKRGGDDVVHHTSDKKSIGEVLNSVDYLVGHNIQRFDVPVLERLLGIKIKPKLIDTLSLSWYLYPSVTRHGLEVWGDKLGVVKPKIADWETGKIEEYIIRCNTDVRINTLLWEKQWARLLDLYGNEADALKLIKYLEFKMDCAREQERSRWKLDVARAEDGLVKLETEKEEKVEQLKEAMPRVPVIGKRSRPAKPFKKDGTESEAGRKWFALLRERSLAKDYSEVVEVITKYKDPKPTSHKQIKDWLFSLGWKPETFEFKRNKETGDVKQIPQVSLKEGKGLCPSVKKLYTKEPRLEVLDGLSVISHRISILKGFLKEVDDEGYVKAEIQGLTNTLRFKHSVCVNLPGVDKPYGELIRGCLTVPDGYELCGADMCSLEDTTKQHYMWDHDPAYVREMQKPGFDPHLDLAMFAGALTPEQVQAHKDETENHKAVRKTYKAANYACVYGAGAATVARAAGIKLKDAKELVEKYWERNWAVRAIPKTIKVKKIGDGSMWLFNPISKFWYSLRAEKDIFSTLNQGTGVYCFDTWVAYVRSKRPQLTAQFHDEVVLCIKKGHREEMTNILKWAIQMVNKKLNLNVRLDIDVQFGQRYSDIH